MSDAERPITPGKGEAEEGQTPVLRRALVWIGGITVLLGALTALSDQGQKFVPSVIALISEISGISEPPSCSGSMTWDERVKCDQRQ